MTWAYRIVTGPVVEPDELSRAFVAADRESWAARYPDKRRAPSQVRPQVRAGDLLSRLESRR